MQGAQVQSLVRELDPTCMLQLRVHMPQLKSQQATTKGAGEPQLRSMPAATKTWYNQKKKKKSWSGRRAGNLPGTRSCLSSAAVAFADQLMKLQTIMT